MQFFISSHSEANLHLPFFHIGFDIVPQSVVVLLEPMDCHVFNPNPFSTNACFICCVEKKHS